MTKVRKFVLLPLLLVFSMIFGVATFTAVAETDIRYADAPFISPRSTSEKIYFTNRIEKLSNETDGKCPRYRQLTNMTNACGTVAGTTIVGFYDKYFPNLIPNWVSYYEASGLYRLQDTTYVPAVMNELYTLMRTNVDDVGVSENDFKTGLQTYVNNRGHNLTYTSVRNWLGKLNFDECKTALDQNKVIALLTKAGEVYDIGMYDGYDAIDPITISGAHIMVAYGYYQVEYYNANGLFRTDTYLKVATGRSPQSLAYYKIDSNNLNAAYIVNIY